MAVEERTYVGIRAEDGKGDVYVEEPGCELPRLLRPRLNLGYDLAAQAHDYEWGTHSVGAVRLALTLLSDRLANALGNPRHAWDLCQALEREHVRPSLRRHVAHT